MHCDAEWRLVRFPVGIDAVLQATPGHGKPCTNHPPEITRFETQVWYGFIDSNEILILGHLSILIMGAQKVVIFTKKLSSDYKKVDHEKIFCLKSVIDS